MKAEEILKIINKCSTLNDNYQIKYVDPIDYSKLANMLEEAIAVTRCSTQLKDRHKVNFDSWLDDNCESIGSGLYLYKDRKCSYNALKIDYRHELEQSL